MANSGARRVVCRTRKFPMAVTTYIFKHEYFCNFLLRTQLNILFRKGRFKPFMTIIEWINDHVSHDKHPTNCLASYVIGMLDTWGERKSFNGISVLRLLTFWSPSKNHGRWINFSLIKLTTRYWILLDIKINFFLVINTVNNKSMPHKHWLKIKKISEKSATQNY